jgi:hypothetical protein
LLLESKKRTEIDGEAFSRSVREQIPKLLKLLFADSGGEVSRLKKVSFEVNLTYYEESDYTDQIVRSPQPGSEASPQNEGE